jgi:hypothetical protein
MNKIFNCLLFLFAFQRLASGQDKINYGISAGITAAKPEVTIENPFGELRAGFGQKICLFASYDFNENLSTEIGAGYFLNRYALNFDGSESIFITGSPLFPFHFNYAHPISENKKFFISAGFAVQYAFTKGYLVTETTDTTTNITIRKKTNVKPYALLTSEIGYKKITEEGRTHQLSIQLFYGWESQVRGIAFHTTTPADQFVFEDKNSFISLGYTFWFKG